MDVSRDVHDVRTKKRCEHHVTEASKEPATFEWDGDGSYGNILGERHCDAPKYSLHALLALQRLPHEEQYLGPAGIIHLPFAHGAVAPLTRRNRLLLASCAAGS